MASFRLDKDFKRKLEKKCQEKAKELAIEARDKLYERYVSLLDWYYLDYLPKLDKYDEPYYTRTFNLYNSAHKYYSNSHSSTFYGGVNIFLDTPDYPSRNGDGFSSQGLLEKFIYNEKGTWHGGNWHGGYGSDASFNIYKEMHKYRDKIYKDMKNRCTIKI